MWQVGDAEKKTNWIQNVRLSTAIQTRYGVEKRIKAADFCPLGVGLEAVDNDRLDMHTEFTVGLINKSMFRMVLKYGAQFIFVCTHASNKF